MDVHRLRSETRREHEAVEAAMPLMDAALTVSAYTEVLQKLYSLISGWDTFAKQAPVSLRPLLEGRQRASLLAADLQSFGASLSAPTEFKLSDFSPPEADPEAVFLGAMYVIEGSTLGGQLLARHLVAHFQHLPVAVTETEGIAYFRGAGERTGKLWKEFQAHLLAVSDTHTDAVISAARSMFDVFRETLLRPVAFEQSRSITIEKEEALSCKLQVEHRAR